MTDDLEETLRTDIRIANILKWGGRALIGVACIDAIQSLFTGATVTEYIHPHSNAFQAYAPDFIAILGGITTECGTRRLDQVLNLYEQKLNSPIGALSKIYRRYHPKE